MLHVHLGVKKMGELDDSKEHHHENEKTKGQSPRQPDLVGILSTVTTSYELRSVYFSYKIPCSNFSTEPLTVLSIDLV